MGLKLIYQMLGKLLSWMALHARSEVRKRTAVWGSLEQAAPSRPLPHRALRAREEIIYVDVGVSAGAGETV
jgi:hypothetical protein